MAREWCSCGAAIRGRRKHILEWRRGHLHTSGEPDPEPQMDGSHAQVELAGFPDKTYTDDGPRQPNIIGFQLTRGRISDSGPEFIGRSAPAVAPSTPSGIYNPAR